MMRRRPSIDPMWQWFALVVLEWRWRVGALVAALALGILLAGQLGRALTALTTPLEDRDCAQPCWRGFRLGAATQEEAGAEVTARNWAKPGTLRWDAGDGSWRALLAWRTAEEPVYDVRMRFTSGVLDQVDLYPQEPVILQEIFGEFGPPTHVTCQSSTSAFSVQLHFYDGAVQVWAVSPVDDLTGPWQVSPSMSVSRITYADRSTGVLGGVPAAYPWAGFVAANPTGLCR